MQQILICSHNLFSTFQKIYDFRAWFRSFCKSHLSPQNVLSIAFSEVSIYNWKIFNSSYYVDAKLQISSSKDFPLQLSYPFIILIRRENGDFLITSCISFLTFQCLKFLLGQHNFLIMCYQFIFNLNFSPRFTSFTMDTTFCASI